MKLTMIKPCHLEQPTWKNSPDGLIYKYDVVIAKNYLTEEELTKLNDSIKRLLEKEEKLYGY